MNISANSETRSELEIGHVLFMDVVGYSKLLNNEQREVQRQLNEIVRGTERFRTAEAAGKLIRLPVGDGMALVFFDSPEAPVQCASEISGAIKAYPQLRLRMGIHSGPVSGLTDVNDRSNVAGAGINMAQRVMDCGDAGHILLSKRVADDLAQEARWRPQLHDLGECSVKHGVGVSVVNFYTPDVGNADVPEKIQTARQQQARGIFRRRSTIAAALLLLMALTALFIYRGRHFSIASAESSVPKSIAVLPLENLSDEKDNAYFADGVQDELLSNLSKIKELKVISRISVMQYKAGITRNLKEIAQQLGVNNVVEGSVRRSGNHMRVSVQLIDALTDRHIWAQNYDRTLADSVALQGELATLIAAQVGATLSPEEKARVAATPTKNPAAYDAYLRGRTFTTFIRPGLEGSIRSYEEAVKLDTDFVLAWAFLSCAQSLEFWSGFDPTPARLAAAKDAVDRAVALNSNLPETHVALGYYRHYGLRDFPGALAEFQTAERGLPNNIDVMRAIGLIHRRMGHWDEAIGTMRRAVELDPRSVDAASNLALTLMVVRHFADAIAMADHVLAIEPSSKEAISLKAYCFWAMGNNEAVELLVANPNAAPQVRAWQAQSKGHYPEASDILSTALPQSEDDQRWRILLDLGLFQQRAGNVVASKATYQQAVQLLTQALSKAASDAAPAAELHSGLGVAYAGLGETAFAIAEGEKGMTMQPSSQDPFEGPVREEQMAQIYSLLGNADEAIAILKRWIAIPSATEITPELMRINPIWDPIRDDRRFQELVADKKP